MRVLSGYRTVVASAGLLLPLALGCVEAGKLQNKGQFRAALQMSPAATGGTPAPLPPTTIPTTTPVTPTTMPPVVTPTAGMPATTPPMGAAGAPAMMGMGGGAGCPMACDLIMTKCAGCHGASGGQGMLDLMSPNVGMRLMGKMSATTTCGGKPLLDPKAPDTSILYKKLTADPGCGLRMPLGGMLTDTELDCVKRWVANPVCP